MTDIRIKTVADLKRALAIPGVLVFMDRNDYMDAELRRNPARLAEMSRPRTVKAVRSVDFIMENGRDGSHMQWPKADELEADGSNVVSISRQGRPGDARKITYRLEAPGTPGMDVPSRLAGNHPALTAEEMDAEATARAAATAEQERRTAEHRDAWDRLRALPAPEGDARFPSLVDAQKAAIREALDARVFYDDEMHKHVVAATAADDFAVLDRLPDVEVHRLESGVAPYVRMGFVQHELAAHPRGTWRLFVEHWPDGNGKSVTALISTGGPQPAHAGQCNFHLDGEAALDNLRGHEVYGLRKVVEAERARTRDADVMKSRGFRVGQELRNLRINGANFSTATIASATEDGAKLGLTMRKRGSRNTYMVDVTASQLDRLSPAAEKEPATAGTLL